MARVSGQALSRFTTARGPLKLRVTDAEQMEPIELPAGAVALFMEILEAMAAGRGVTIIPENAELSIPIGQKLGAEIIKADGDVVTGDCHLANGAINEQTGRVSLHPIQLVARAYGIPEEQPPK